MSYSIEPHTIQVELPSVFTSI